MYELGLCNKAFELFKQSTRRGFPGGMMMLGYCYDEGIGTEIRWNCKRCQ
jgi:TPR repeat protein